MEDQAILELLQSGEAKLEEKRKAEEEKQRAYEQEMREKQAALEANARMFILPALKPYVTNVNDDGFYGVFITVEIPGFAPLKIKLLREGGRLGLNDQMHVSYVVPGIGYSDWDWTHNDKHYRDSDLPLALVAARDLGVKFAEIQRMQREAEKQYDEDGEPVKTAEYVPVDQNGEPVEHGLIGELVTFIRDVVREELFG